MYPVIFSYGPLHLYSYGLLVATGVLCAIFFIRSNAMLVGLNPDTSVDLAIATVISGFTGARIFYVIQFWDFFKNAPLDVFKIWQGGIVLYGGLIGGLLGFAFFIKLSRLSFLPVLDLFVPAMSLAQGFGRLGCFLNGCCFGAECDLPWAVKFSFLGEKVHPTQLYEAVFCFLLFVFLYRLLKKKLSAGKVALAYFIIYPIGRFLVEFFRGDQKYYLFHLTIAQWTSVLVIILTLIFILFRYGKNPTHRPS